jgi:uncharacterized membrane protein SpoIIM required for sporulation/ABC-type transport system involved in multi-copper enzyme maturation permease subunit
MNNRFVEIRQALVITEREVRDQLRDWRIIFPVLGLTVFFPFLMNFTAQQILGFVSKYGANIIGERLVPFLLMIVGFFPISVSLVIALETFVGEKERGSIEPLLNTPLKDWQLYLGKLLSATVPPLLSGFLGMSVYIAGLVYNHIKLPPPVLMFQIVVLTIAQAMMMVSGAVVVSSQATSVRAANLLASFIIIPVALLIQGESVVMFWGDFSTLWTVVFGVLVLTILLMRVGMAHFQREELLGREIDVLNFRWMWGVFRSQFTGGAKSLWDWYHRVLPRSIRLMRLPMLMVTCLAIGGVIIGIQLTYRFQIPLKALSMDTATDRLSTFVRFSPLFSVSPVFGIWWQNIRALVIAMVLGTFSFGILGMIPLFATMTITGYLAALLVGNGIPPISFVGLVLPHGIIEIPAAILATAAVLQAGAVLATPNTEKTVGEVWLTALANWAKIMLGAVIPMLLVAAAVEAWITPQIALWLLH